MFFQIYCRPPGLQSLPRPRLTKHRVSLGAGWARVLHGTDRRIMGAVVAQRGQMGVSIVMGYPQQLRGFTAVRETPNLKWMITRGTPVTRKPPYEIIPAREPKQCVVRILKGKVERTKNHQWLQASRTRATLIVKAWC